MYQISDAIKAAINFCAQLGRSRTISKKIPEAPNLATYLHEAENNFTEMRLKYAGAIGLLCSCSLELPSSSEMRDSIIAAVDDWCNITGWSYKQILSRIELIPPKAISK